jgi:hypothetical protein
LQLPAAAGYARAEELADAVGAQQVEREFATALEEPAGDERGPALVLQEGQIAVEHDPVPK